MSNLSQFTGYFGSTGYVGSQGIPGDPGYTGSTGVGFTGSQGETGYTGSASTATGYTGSVGPQGTSITMKGTVADETALLAIVDMAVNDAWIRTDTENLYVWNGATWTDVGQIVGPAGNTGYTGSTGVGYTGSTGIGYTGSAGETGAASTATGYTGSAGIGYTGSRGDQGLLGYVGSQGDTGYIGSQGIESTQPLIIVTATTYVAVSGSYYVLTNVEAPTTITLPTAPAISNKVTVSNATGRTDAVIARNGANIMSTAEDLTINYSSSTVRLCYVDSTIGWFLV